MRVLGIRHNTAGDGSKSAAVSCQHPPVGRLHGRLLLDQLAPIGPRLHSRGSLFRGGEERQRDSARDRGHLAGPGKRGRNGREVGSRVLRDHAVSNRRCGDCHRPSERVVGSGSRQQPSRLTNERKRSDDPGNEREESRTRPGHIRNTFSSNFSKMLQQIYPRRAVVIWAELPRCPGSRLDVVLGGLSVRHSAARGPRSRFAIGHDRTAGHGWHLGLSRPGPRDPCPGRRHRAQLGRRYPGMGRRRGYQAQRRRLAAEPPRGRDGTP